MTTADIIRLGPDDECPGVTHEADVKLREVDGWTQTATIVQPEKPTGGGIAVLIHGGGFSMRNLRPMTNMGRILARELGMTTVVPIYRLGGEGNPSYPKPVEDVAFAWEWAQAHAAEWGADAEKMVAGGSSAGGTLSALALVKGMLPGCRGLLEYWGPLDFIARWFDNGEKQGGDFNLLGANYPDNVTLYHDASVVTHVTPGLPPAVFIYGRQDQTVHLRQGELGCSAWKKAGNEADLLVLDNIGHGMVGDNTGQMVKVADRSVAFVHGLF
ncbi:alpha/beta hydrolase [Cerasicoccus fimbriatus]|uniref:alpha/beta hydrolase n=1 Tax=Cerasicoccus fimbriatus TaxID=3014554 RepID=UPI0022B35AE9|nr:alpha/beta hydrolase [Cerasicoccus sp. TK19100]